MWTQSNHPIPLPRSWPSGSWGPAPEWWSRAVDKDIKAQALRERLARTVPLTPEVLPPDPLVPLAVFDDPGRSGDARRVHLTPRGGHVLLPSTVPSVRVWVHSVKGCTVTIRGDGLTIPPNVWVVLPRIETTRRIDLSTLKTGDVVVALDIP